MYHKIKGGTCEVIYNDYPCYIPPVPPHHEILFHNFPKEEQYWRRTPIPDAFKELFREESAIRKQEQERVERGEIKKVTYVNPILEKYRRQEFHRRLWGVWFYNNGVPTYITGHHYLYLQWWKSDNGYPHYYEFSRKGFYFRQYSEEDPFALGYMIIGPRGTGKCLGKGTKVMMFTGGCKKVEEVKSGDLLMGPDSKPREVLELSSGVSDLYEVVQNRAMNYVVNDQHILALKRNTGSSFTGRIKKGKYKANYPSLGRRINIPVMEFIKKSQTFKNTFSGYKVGVEYDPDSITRIDAVNFIGKGEYFGFSVDGDHLFCLEDGTVTHNSQEELCCIFNNMTLLHNATAALQSKHYENDAIGILFKTKLVLAFNSMPQMFKPVFSHGSNPENGFAFNRAAIKGKESLTVEYGDDFELNSFITPVRPGNMVLDGDTAKEIFEDEIGKTKDEVADVYERHKVNLKVVWRNHKKVGLIRKTSTVEKMKEGGKPCKKLWTDSDPKKRDANGQTVSKINRFFLSALDTDTSTEIIRLPDGTILHPACNKYGFVDRQIANRKIQAALDAIAHDYVALSSEMRKNPRHEAEAFIEDQSMSIFNIQKLTNRLNHLRNELPQVPYIKGNLYWLKEKFGPVGWATDQHAGRFNWNWFPDEYKKIGDPKDWKILNAYDEEMGYDMMGRHRLLKVPKNDHLFRIATDPIKYSKTKDPRASKASIHAFRMLDPDDIQRPKAKWQSHNFLCEYTIRPEDPETYLEDLAMLCIFLGAKVLPERNVPAVNAYFDQNGLHRYMAYPREMVLSGIDIQTNSDDAGYASTSEVINLYATQIIKFINEHIDRMPFDDTIEDWINFDPTSPTTSHATVSSGFALVHALKISDTNNDSEGESIDNYMDTADNSGINGRWNDSEDSPLRKSA